MTIRELIAALEGIAAERGDAIEVRTHHDDWGSRATRPPVVHWRPAGDDGAYCLQETEEWAREHAADFFDLEGDAAEPVAVVLIE